MISDKNKKVFFTLDKRTVKKLEEIAAEENRSVSNLIATMVKDAIKLKGK